jgi:hypothetical protein
MNTLVFALLLLSVVVLVYLIVALRTWMKVRGARIVVCPETQLPVAVNVDVGHNVVSAILGGPDVRLTACSRWPERQDCDQPCTRQIEIAPSDTDPRTIAGHYFSKERCAICSRPIEPPSHTAQQPGFMEPVTHRVQTWNELPAWDLPRAIATFQPLCSNCTLAELFRQRSPDRVTDRPAH